MAFRSHQNWILWAVGGGIFALVTTTIIMGLTQAAFIPFSSHEAAVFRVRAILVSIVVILVLGWLITKGLHRKHRE
jgi:MFS-type transporter involved in bile tolerance (Atg22 family)